MKCPNCKETFGVNVSMHSEGYTSSTPLECSICGTIWTGKEGDIDIIKEGIAVIAA